MNRTQSSTSLYLLSVAFLVLSFIYIITAIYSFVRIVKVCRNEKPIYLARVFYILIFLSCLAYTICMAYFLLKVGDKENQTDKGKFEKMSLNTIYVPDAIFLLIYVTLYWKVIQFYYEAHMQSGNLGHNDQQFDPTSQKAQSRLELVYFVYILSQTIVIVLFNVDFLKVKVCVMINLVINCSIPFSLIICEIYLNVKYSGSPFISKNYEKNTIKLNRLVMFLAIMRVIQIALNVILLSYLDNIYEYLAQGSTVSFKQIGCIVGFVIDLLLVSVIPFIYALNHEFVKIFLNQKKTQLLLAQVEDEEQFEHTITPEDQKIQSLGNSNLSGVKMKTQYRQTADSSISERKLIQFHLNDIELVEQQEVKRNNGLGSIRFGKLGQQEYCFRVIEFKQLSRYVLEEVDNEIKRLNELKHDYLAHIHGYCYDNNTIALLMKKYNNGSLEQAINEDRCQQKLQFAIQIGRALEYLHNQKIYHGQLTPSNIMINKNYCVKLVDLGFLPLKKYCSILFGYQNKSQYSAPEILTEKGTIVSNPTEASDVYSFGMVMYTVFQQKIPFKVFLIIHNVLQEVSYKDYYRIVVDQHGRPKLLDDNEQIVNLIRWCWQQDPKKRPKITEVLQALENIREQAD